MQNRSIICLLHVYGVGHVIDKVHITGSVLPQMLVEPQEILPEDSPWQVIFGPYLTPRGPNRKPVAGDAHPALLRPIQEVRPAHGGRMRHGPGGRKHRYVPARVI